jgi:glutamate carboxypeptidase
MRTPFSSPPAARALALGASVVLPILLSSASFAGPSISSPIGKKAAPVHHGKPVPASQSALTSDERKLVESVKRGVPTSLALLERVVNVNSGTLDLDGVHQVGTMFDAELKALGFTTRWADGAAWNRAGHLIGTRAPKTTAPVRGRPGIRDLGHHRAPADVPRLLLIGHLDTVFEKDSPFQRFQRLDDSTATGPGVCDMKGGDVVMLLALRALQENGLLDRMAVTVFLCGDEERNGDPLERARRDLRDLAAQSDVAIGFEDGAGDPRTALVARRGASSWRLSVTGRPYHSSQIFRPDVGAGAIFEAARILESFRDSLGGESMLTFNPGWILGGTTVEVDSSGSRGSAFGKTNVVAEHAEADGDLRSLTLEQRERAKATMQRIAGAHLPHTDGTLTFDDGYPPMAPSDGNRRLLALYDRVSRDLGQGGVEATDPLNAGAADVAFASDRVKMALDGVGLMGKGAHTVGETADLRTLSTQGQRVAILLERLTRDWAKLAKP